jgi:hypothetical protein
MPAWEKQKGNPTIISRQSSKNNNKNVECVASCGFEYCDGASGQIAFWINFVIYETLFREICVVSNGNLNFCAVNMLKENSTCNRPTNNRKCW